jgi:hypothetical protein
MAYPEIFLERPRKTMKALSQDNKCSDWNSKLAPPEYNSIALPLDHSVWDVALYNLADTL